MSAVIEVADLRVRAFPFHRDIAPGLVGKRNLER
jgi:hypothetical protein